MIQRKASSVLCWTTSRTNAWVKVKVTPIQPWRKTLSDISGTTLENTTWTSLNSWPLSTQKCQIGYRRNSRKLSVNPEHFPDRVCVELCASWYSPEKTIRRRTYFVPNSAAVCTSKTNTLSFPQLEWSVIVIIFTDVRYGPKVGQIGPKWDKSGFFFQIWIWSEKIPQICPIWGQSDSLWAHIWSARLSYSGYSSVS